MKNIITVQHTQSVHHTNGMVGSWTDWELTETGKQQADNMLEKRLTIDCFQMTVKISLLFHTEISMFPFAIRMTLINVSTTA